MESYHRLEVNHFAKDGGKKTLCGFEISENMPVVFNVNEVTCPMCKKKIRESDLLPFDKKPESEPEQSEPEKKEVDPVNEGLSQLETKLELTAEQKQVAEKIYKDFLGILLTVDLKQREYIKLLLLRFVKDSK